MSSGESSVWLATTSNLVVQAIEPPSGCRVPTLLLASLAAMSLLRPLLLVTLLALAGTATVGAAPASAVTVKCGLKRFSFVFWPKGNRAEALPHFDFYKLTSSYP